MKKFNRIASVEMKKFKRRYCVTSSDLPKLPDFDYTPKPYKGLKYDKIQTIQNEHIVPCIQQYYKKPLLLHEGKMQWLFDHEGKRYLDMIGGIVTVSIGHCHPKVTQAAHEQMDTLWHSTNVYQHPKLYEYAEELTSTLPSYLNVNEHYSMS